MLTHLTIQNVALIERQELEFSSGLTLITGETGAGKSILLDALALAMGMRADSGLIRSDCDQSMVIATFFPAADHPARLWLAEQALATEPQEEIFLRRVLSRNGRHKAFINETAVPLATLNQLGGMLVEIHGQHDQQALLNPASHLAILDAFANHQPLLDAVAAQFGDWRRLNAELEQVRAALRDAGERRAFLLYHLEELEQAAVRPGELEELEGRRARLSHATRLAESTDRALVWLTRENPSAATALGKAASELESAQRIDPDLAPLAEAARSLQYEADSLAERLNHYLDGLETDPFQLEELLERVELIRRLSRKHRRDPSDLEALSSQWQAELTALDQGDANEAQLEKGCAKSLLAYQEAALRLGESRRAAALRLNREVERELKDLRMSTTRFAVTLRSRSGQPHALGMEEASFEVSPNPGEPLKPLRQIASGGELSRIMLAIKTILAGADMAVTLIFDEVDAGVGGRAATSIGEKLARVAQSRQVFAVTHLPQVASWANHHLRVEKSASEGKTQVAVVLLNEEERVEELARMLAGDAAAEAALATARALLQAAHGPAPVKRRTTRQGA